jgi:hypothetical protein
MQQKWEDSIRSIYEFFMIMSIIVCTCMLCVSVVDYIRFTLLGH